MYSHRPTCDTSFPIAIYVYTCFQEGIVIFCLLLLSTEIYNSQSYIILTSALGLTDKISERKSINLLKNYEYLHKEIYLPAAV